MIRTIEAVVDERSRVHLLEDVEVSESRRALVTILDEDPRINAGEPALLSEQALAEDWNRPEEDEAWSYLQSSRSSPSVSFFRPVGIEAEACARLDAGQSRRLDGLPNHE